MLHIVRSYSPLNINTHGLDRYLTVRLTGLSTSAHCLGRTRTLLSTDRRLIDGGVGTLARHAKLTPTRVAPTLALLHDLGPSPNLLFRDCRPSCTRPPTDCSVPSILIAPVHHRRARGVDGHGETSTATRISN